jgi:hypothetical protein
MSEKMMVLKAQLRQVRTKNNKKHGQPEKHSEGLVSEDWKGP